MKKLKMTVAMILLTAVGALWAQSAPTPTPGPDTISREATQQKILAILQQLRFDVNGNVFVNTNPAYTFTPTPTITSTPTVTPTPTITLTPTKTPTPHP